VSGPVRSNSRIKSYALSPNIMQMERAEKGRFRFRCEPRAETESQGQELLIFNNKSVIKRLSVQQDYNVYADQGYYTEIIIISLDADFSFLFAVFPPTYQPLPLLYGSSLRRSATGDRIVVKNTILSCKSCWL
jgi:hypothetical protein